MIILVYTQIQRSGEYLWEWILRVGNGRKNIKLDQALFIDIGPLNRDPGLSV